MKLVEVLGRIVHFEERGYNVIISRMDFLKLIGQFSTERLTEADPSGSTLWTSDPSTWTKLNLPYSREEVVRILEANLTELRELNEPAKKTESVNPTLATAANIREYEPQKLTSATEEKCTCRQENPGYTCPLCCMEFYEKYRIPEQDAENERLKAEVEKLKRDADADSEEHDYMDRVCVKYAEALNAIKDKVGTSTRAWHLAAAALERAARSGRRG